MLCDMFVKGFKKTKIAFWKKVTVELVRSPFWYFLNPLILCKEGFCVGLGQDWAAWGWGRTVWNAFKTGVEQKRGGTKILRRGQAGSRGGCLKIWVAGTPYELWNASIKYIPNNVCVSWHFPNVMHNIKVIFV